METSEISPTESIDKPTIPSKKKKISIWFFVALVLLCTNVYLIIIRQKPEVLPEIPDTTPVVTPPTVVKGNYSDLLSENCVEEKVSVSKLPFTLSEELIADYSIVDGNLPCSNYSETSEKKHFIYKEINLDGDKGELSRRSLFVFHKESLWMGMEDPFAPLSNFSPVVIDGDYYWLYIKSPGPFGVSSDGLWVDVMKEKRDVESGTVVRAVRFKILRDKEIIDLIKLYGTKTPDEALAENGEFPEYTLVGHDDITLFKQHLISLLEKSDILASFAVDVTEDLSGLIF